MQTLDSQWVYDDDLGNVERKIDVSLRSVDTIFPNGTLIRYDSTTSQLYRTDTGQQFANRGQLAGLVGQSIKSRLGMAGGAGATGYAGWRTVARAAVLNDLKASARMAPGEPNRGAILDRLREVGARLERDEATGQGYPAKERIFYSRFSIEGQTAFSRTQAPRVQVLAW